MLKALADEYPEVRQAAAYGFGIMGMIGGADYLNSVTSALEPLATMVNKWVPCSYPKSSSFTILQGAPQRHVQAPSLELCNFCRAERSFIHHTTIISFLKKSVAEAS